MAGSFIVIDGTDGSGKATQVGLLVERLEREGKKVKTIDFPRYYDNFFGALIGDCLAGKHGNFLEVDSRIASVVYAADRFESSKQIREWLEAGNVVIADRYVSSNQIHQGAKISDDAERKEFLSWLDKMEHEVFGIPRPDAILFLDVPVAVSQKLLKEKSLEHKKRYAKGGADLAEANPEHLEAARQSACRMVQENNTWIHVDCIKDGSLRSREDIHEEVFRRLSPFL